MASPVTPSATPTSAAGTLREALASRVVVADGAMGTMLQDAHPTLEDFQQLEGCSEILNVSRPDIVRSVHEAYFAAGVDCVGTNTFGANLSALGEYDIADRIVELSEAGARIAREVADAFAAEDGRPRWVLGSMGPGTKLPTLGHVSYPQLRDAYQRNAEGLVAGGADALLVETSQDLLQTKAAVLGARRALTETRRRPAADLLGDSGDDRHDAARLGDRRGTDSPGTAGHRRDRPELRDRSGGDERAPAPPLAPRPGPPVLHAERRPAGAGQGRCSLPADPRRTRRRAGHLHRRLRSVTGRRVLRHHARTPATARRAGARPRPRARARRARSRAPRRCTRLCPSARTPPISPSASGPTQTARRSSAPPCWTAGGRTAWRWRAIRSGRARTCWTCASTTWAGTGSPTCTSWPAGSPPPPPCRSCWTPPSRPSCRPDWRSSAAAPCSTPSTTRTATDRTRGSRRSPRWPPNTVPRSSR